MPYIESRSAIFIQFFEEKYFDRLKITAKKIIQKERNLDNFYVPKFQEQSPYKLHISLCREHYTAHHQALKEIVLRHLENGAFYSFKQTDNELIDEELSQKQAKLAYLKIQQDELAEELKEPKAPHNGSRHLANENMIHEMRTEDTAEQIKKTEQAIESCNRFLTGDQITIYIHDNFDKDKILSFCEEINTFLTMKKAIPGMRYDIESPLGSFINLRQEFLLDDFNEMNQSECYRAEKRINTVPDNSLESDPRRSQFIDEQKNCALYKYLEKIFMPIKKSESHLDQVSIFKLNLDSSTKNTGVPPAP